MGTRGDNILRSLLKSYEIKTPPPTFTDEVVREIEAMAGDQVYASASLKGALKKNVAQSPSTEFTYKVLNKIREQPHASYPPIIGKKVWAFIITFLIACVISAFTIEPPDDAGSLLNYLPVGEFVGKLTLHFGEPLFYSAIIIVSATLLLALDYVIKGRSRTGRSD